MLNAARTVPLAASNPIEEMSKPIAPTSRPRNNAPLLTTPTTAIATSPSMKNSAAPNEFTIGRATGIVINRKTAPITPPMSEARYAAESATPALPCLAMGLPSRIVAWPDVDPGMPSKTAGNVSPVGTVETIPMASGKAMNGSMP